MDKDNKIAVKTKAFANRIIKMYNFLYHAQKEYVLSKQVLRSGTSIGANVRESIFAQSKADFINKMSVALKESSETEYWLELLYENEYLDEKAFKSIYDENCQITAMLISIVKNSKEPK